jgi:hypothetical protein
MPTVFMSTVPRTTTSISPLRDAFNNAKRQLQDLHPDGFRLR